MQKLLTFQKVLADIFGLLVLVLMFLVVIDVGGRFVFNSPLKGGTETSEMIMTWILFLPLAYALVKDAHVRVTMAVMHLPPRSNLVVEVLGTSLSIAFFGVIAYVSWLKFWQSFSAGEAMAATIWLPLWLQKLALPVGLSVFSLQLCANLVERIGKLRRFSNGY